MESSGFILGIDTSCDDTSVAILDSATGRILANLVSSQIESHAPFGGVVPELASRHHTENLPLVYEKALSEAQVSQDQIKKIAVTNTPGLMGCLLVGVNFAKALAYRLELPLVAVNHLQGHLFSPFIESTPVFPFLGLVVSGGHTAFYDVRAFDDVSLIGQTVDDAAGEAYDKCAKMLSLGYPGGPVIDRLAGSGDEHAFKFSPVKVRMGESYLSFSGLKTAAYHHWLKAGEEKFNDQDVKNLCASFQKSIVGHLMQRAQFFLTSGKYRAFALSGGVAMNSELRKQVQNLCLKMQIECHLAKPQYTTDNAAMIAYAGLQQQPVSLDDVVVMASKKIQARKLFQEFKKSQ